MTIVFTDSAITEAKLLLSKRGEKNDFIRLGVKGGGCSGFAYIVVYDDEFKEGRDILLMSDGDNNLFVTDKKSILYIEDSNVDYEKKLTERGFKIINPREKSKCGCNKSFTV